MFFLLRKADISQLIGVPIDGELNEEKETQAELFNATLEALVQQIFFQDSGDGQHAPLKEIEALQRRHDEARSAIDKELADALEALNTTSRKWGLT